MNARELAEVLTRPDDPAKLVDLMAPDGVVEWPYRPDGVPGVLRGKEEVAAFVRAAAGSITFLEYTDVTIHETTDPEVVIVEYTAQCLVNDTGVAFTQRPIQVIRVREGKIVSLRDYINPLPLIAATGGRVPTPGATPGP
ncbi:MAG: nuclear transport factor 2 family protein [Nonomuraea sp.]|nr:nuclear transport factor 2 family protein [Nonomuraea sp.]